MKADTLLKQIVLEPEKKSREVREFEERLRGKIIGQEEAVAQLVNVYQTVVAGMSGPGRPIANLLFLGPTGSGKTRLVEAAAEILFSSPTAFIKVDCAEFQHSHEISKLIGTLRVISAIARQRLPSLKMRSISTIPISSS
jgi:ATP-dependent Clp protease ATP-binding subunit ClpA